MEGKSAIPPAPKARPWWDLPPEKVGLLALALLFLATIPMLTKIFTSDFGTHLALGRYVVQEHDIPDREHWNYPSLGMENGSGGEWGFQAVLYLVYSAGGQYAVSFLIWAVVAGIFFFLHRATVLRGAHPLLAVLAIFAFSGFLRIRIQPRPEIFTYLFSGLRDQGFVFIWWGGLSTESINSKFWQKYKQEDDYRDGTCDNTDPPHLLSITHTVMIVRIRTHDDSLKIWLLSR